MNEASGPLHEDSHTYNFVNLRVSRGDATLAVSDYYHDTSEKSRGYEDADSQVSRNSIEEALDTTPYNPNSSE